VETIEVKWAIHEDVVAMEHSLKVIASVRPCPHCDGTGVVPVLTARQAATQAAQALNALEETA